MYPASASGYRPRRRPEDQRQRLKHVLSPFISQNIPLQFEQNSELMAGVRISIGGWVLGANLQDELKGFMELSHDE